MSETITRPIVIELPLDVYAELVANSGDVPIEALAARLLGEASRWGEPLDLRVKLDTVLDVVRVHDERREERREKLNRVRARLERIAAELGQQNRGV